MNILIIDDDFFVLKLLGRQLANLGYPQVTVCQQAVDAMGIIENASTPFDLLFCDIQMPELDGVELLRQIAQHGFRGGLVLMSGEDERILHAVSYLAQAHKLRVLNAFTKPVKPEQLQRILEQQLSFVVRETAPAKKVYGPDEVRHAIHNGELVNYYQPKVSSRTGEVVGVETLVRWQHPVDGLVFPDQFITTAEQSRLIDDLTRVVLINALKQCRGWRDDGLDLSVAVNISMNNLNSLDFPDFIVDVARTAAVELPKLVLEITESQLMNNPVTALDILTRLRLKHITLSIDDFGTGHSSLRQLRDIAFNELKVDAGFVHGASQSPSQRAILRASVDMARGLGMQSVAEGVENADDWNFLLDLDLCDIMQGYFIARPMPASAMKDWMQEWEMRRHDLMAGIGRNG
ncbi:EAL domain-containing response regulator [Marinobacterium rhizophilum]|uniref:EAL domain-containing response regulator n=1 Tax=Marinobacterium rhizophilum TaxID=420402 RepID=A0ABY5HD75_9GAMM|nr:EAL domain-containing response regulator [Marinobacterium rhizophilum]UTW10074.1 EAL domain-containing response regulator [Marinobacterium rhizophilum]